MDSSRDDRYWHLADVPTAFVGFRVRERWKRVSRPLLTPKRTSLPGQRTVIL